jgi:large subunit ribosomal protein L2
MVSDNYSMASCRSASRRGTRTAPVGGGENVTIENNECSRSGEEHGVYVSNSADRPTVRGKAMNPVSHPCGGGDGRGGVGRQPCNWKGTKLAKGGKTRRSKKPSQRFIVRFRRTGKHQANRR